MTLTLLDDFNRADGSLGANWTSPIGFITPQGRIVSNQAGVTDSGGAEAGQYWNVTQFDADQELSMALYLTDPAAYVYYLLNCTIAIGAIVDCYLIALTKSSVNIIGGNIYRMNASSFTGSLHSWNSEAYADGDVYSFHKEGGLFTYKRNGSTIDTYTDSSPLTAPGYVGFGGRQHISSFVDDFSAGSISAATPAAVVYKNVSPIRLP